MPNKTLGPGRPALGKAKRLRLSMTLRPELVERLGRYAASEGLSASRFAEQLLEQGLRARRRQAGNVLARLGVEAEQVAGLCRALGVRRLDLFGSALTPSFGPHSDVDLLAEFQPGAIRTLLDRGRVQMEFERLFKRPVDLAELRLIPDPLRRREIEATRQEIYAG